MLGRRNLVRLGRFLLNAGRMDGDNEQTTNGEFLFIGKILKDAVLKKSTAVFFDIGANTGLVSSYAASVLRDKGVIFAAEPCQKTFENLEMRLRGLKTRTTLIHAAFSDKDGKGELQVVDDNAGTNSLVKDTTSCIRTEVVDLFRLDEFARKNAISYIDFVKIDTEGHDFSVLSGCKEMLSCSCISAIQFEYNWRWIGQRHFLRDVFEFKKQFKDYSIGKVTRLGIEIYEGWTPNIETLIENNYTIIKNEKLDCVRLIKPWFE
jgi:FkbM family methyltransferase